MPWHALDRSQQSPTIEPQPRATELRDVSSRESGAATEPNSKNSTAHSVSRGMARPPAVARIAGLPARVLAPLSSSANLAQLNELLALEEELASKRQKLVDAISEGLLQFNSSARGFLLKIKRNCYNQRSIAKYLKEPSWLWLEKISSNLPNQIAELERQCRDLEDRISDRYDIDYGAERRHVISLTQDSRFVRGIALGRLGLVEKILSRAPLHLRGGDLGKAQKWESSLLRFVTRAASKLSANSTLTAYSLGHVKNSSTQQCFHFYRTPHREISLVRIDRPEIEQFVALLMRHPTVKARGLLAWNESLKEIEPGRYRFIRNRYWDLKPGADSFCYEPPARVTTRLPHEFLTVIRGALMMEPLPYLEVLSLLEANPSCIDVECGYSIRETLDHIVAIGCLQLLPPWPTQEDRLEQRIFDLVESLADDPILQVVRSGLKKLLELETGLSMSLRPIDLIVELKATYSSLLQTVLPSQNDESLQICSHLYEDVFFEPIKPAEPSQAIEVSTFEVSSSTVGQLFESAALASQFASLFNTRHDLLHTLAGWWRQNEPRRREIPLVEVARGFSMIWKGYLPFVNRASESATNTFNPLGTDSLAELLELRRSLLASSAELVERAANKDNVSPTKLASLLESIPPRYAPVVGCSLFVQPTNATANSWVLNQIHEGTGRYLSRLTPVLDGALRDHFVDHLVERSSLIIDGEEADLLEVTDPNAYLTNAHPIQAARVLHFQGLHLEVEPERRVKLGDLRIQADLDAEYFRVLDADGRRVLPVHLSSRRDAALSSILRFLLVFGPGETRGVFPFPYTETEGDMRIFNRLTVGSLILHRRRWDLPVQGLSAAIAGLTDLDTYKQIHAWRRKLDLPTVGYFYERTYSGGLKPQFVDFSSPSLCRLFATSIRKQAEKMKFQEALPLPEDFPRDNEGQRRGVELLIDGLAIRTPSRNKSAGYCYAI